MIVRVPGPGRKRSAMPTITITRPSTPTVMRRSSFNMVGPRSSLLHNTLPKLAVPGPPTVPVP